MDCESIKVATKADEITYNTLEELYFTLTEYDDSEEIDTSEIAGSTKTFKLVPFKSKEPFVRIDVFPKLEYASRAHTNVYKRILEVAGKSYSEPGFVIYAEWKITDSTKVESFVESRIDLFNLRKEFLENFSFDILTQNLSEPGQFLIIGFYKNEEGLEQARNHPAIKEWAKNNPPGKFSAIDLFTPKRFRVKAKQ